MATQQEFTLAAFATVNMIQNLKSIQDTFLDTVTDIYHGQINLHLLPPSQLLGELQVISSQLNKELALPVDDVQSNLYKVYKLLKIKTRFTKEYFIFEISIPLISRDTFQLYHLIPVPLQINNSMISIQPVADYVAINLRRNVFISASINDIQNCESQDDTYTCRLHRPINNLDPDERFCVKDRASCVLARADCKNKWVQLHDYSTYLYFCCDAYSLRVICDDKVQNYQVSKAGLIRLTKQCIVKGRDVTLHAYQHFENTLQLEPDIISTQLSPINHIVGSNNSLSILNEIDNDVHVNESLKQLEEQIRLMKEAAEPTEILSVHDVHHYVLSYGLLAAAVIAFLCFLRWRGRRANSSSRQRQPELVLNSVCTNECRQTPSVSARVETQNEAVSSVSARKPGVEQSLNRHVVDENNKSSFAKRWSSVRIAKRDVSTSPVAKRQTMFTIEDSSV